jgi:filamentous hemagglutinin
MFYATPAQKADATMYLSAVLNDPQTLKFYQDNKIKQPTIAQITQAAGKDAQSRNELAALTIKAAAAAGGLALAPALSGLAAEAAAFTKNPVAYCLANPMACVAGVDVAAATAAGVPMTGASLPLAGGAKPITSGGTANAASGARLAEQLQAELLAAAQAEKLANLTNIAAQDARLAAAVKGPSTSSPNYSIGTGSASEAEKLGQIWVGEGARPINGVPGGLISADGSRIYRPPTYKPNTPAEFNPTGIQANFQTRDPITGQSLTNGHLVIK